jgi:hypothetical protein
MVEKAAWGYKTMRVKRTFSTKPFKLRTGCGYFIYKHTFKRKKKKFILSF